MSTCLKPYYARVSDDANSESASGLPHFAFSVGRVSTVYSPQSVFTELEDSLPGVDSAVFQGRLKNSESLRNLRVLLGHLAESKQADLCNVIKSFPCLFSDTPTQTNLIEHDIDVGDAQPVRQRFYRVNPEKRKHLDVEIKYMLDNGIAEPSSSS